ncbi:unnamed protein product, partial [Polarella glacialis]
MAVGSDTFGRGSRGRRRSAHAPPFAARQTARLLVVVGLCLSAACSSSMLLLWASPVRQLVGSTTRLSSRMALRAVAQSAAQSTAVEADFEALSTRLKDISALGGISGLLGWDEMTMMPAGASAYRAAQKEALAGVLYSKSTDPALGDLLTRLGQADLAGLNAYQQASVREASRDFKKTTALSEELVRREAGLETKGYATWVQARKAKDWSMFSPVLREWVTARKERAAMIDASKPPYDVLADDYSAGLTAARIQEVFDEVKTGLVPFLAELREKGTAPDDSWLKGDFDTEKQAGLCRDISVALGFDLEKGRLDVSVHPFTGGSGPTDVRMTTRFKKEDVTEGITGAIHETGHALYEQGRNEEYDGLPVSQAAGMAIHESQSLLWERMVALSLPFSRYLLPKLRESFPG